MRFVYCPVFLLAAGSAVFCQSHPAAVSTIHHGLSKGKTTLLNGSGYPNEVIKPTVSSPFQLSGRDIQPFIPQRIILSKRWNSELTNEADMLYARSIYTDHTQKPAQSSAWSRAISEAALVHSFPSSHLMRRGNCVTTECAPGQRQSLPPLGPWLPNPPYATHPSQSYIAPSPFVALSRNPFPGREPSGSTSASPNTSPKGPSETPPKIPTMERLPGVIASARSKSTSSGSDRSRSGGSRSMGLSTAELSRSQQYKPPKQVQMRLRTAASIDRARSDNKRSPKTSPPSSPKMTSKSSSGSGGSKGGKPGSKVKKT